MVELRKSTVRAALLLLLLLLISSCDSRDPRGGDAPGENDDRIQGAGNSEPLSPQNAEELDAWVRIVEKLAAVEQRSTRIAGVEIGLVRVLLRTRDFSHGSFGETDFSGLSLPHARLACVRLGAASFERANLQSTDFSSADAALATFSGSSAQMADFSNCDLEQAKFVGADISGARMANANLLMTDFSNAILRDVDFAGAMLDGSTLRNADLRGADLSEAFCLQVDWIGAICPDGEPASRDHGCICGHTSFDDLSMVSDRVVGPAGCGGQHVPLP